MISLFGVEIYIRGLGSDVVLYIRVDDECKKYLRRFILLSIHTVPGLENQDVGIFRTLNEVTCFPFCRGRVLCDLLLYSFSCMHYMSGEGSPNVGFFLQTSVVLPVERQITTLGTGVCPHPSPHLQTNNLDGYMGMTAILLRRGVGPVLWIEGQNNS